MWKKLLSLLLIVCLLSTLVSCGSYNPIIPEEEVGLEDVTLVQVNDPEGNILVLAGRDNGELVMALGEKDENGMTEKITGVFYTTGNEEGFFIELKNDGLPLSLVDTNGAEITYSNYTDSTVEISIYDNKGNLIAGPTVVDVDPHKIKEIKELFQLYKSGARGWSETAEIFKVVGLIVGTFTAAVVFVVGVVPATVAAAGVSLLLIVISTITSNDVDDVVSIGWGAVTCLPTPITCIGPASSILGEAIELIAEEENENHPPTISSLTANPSSVDISQTTTITCIASDPDGDPLTYHWTKNVGSFEGNTSGPSVTWRAPSTADIYTILCAVSDGEGGEDNESINIVVKPDEKEEIENVLEKFGSAMNNENWGKAKTYCVPNSQAVGSVDEYASAINELNSLCDEWDFQCNWSSNEGTIVISGSNATATTPGASCTMTCVVGTEEFSVSGSGYDIYYLKKIDGNWLISEIGGNAVIDSQNI